MTTTKKGKVKAESMIACLADEAPQGAEETNEQEGSTADIGAEGDDEEA